MKDLAILVATKRIVQTIIANPFYHEDIARVLSQAARYRTPIDPAAPTYPVVFGRTEAGRTKPWEERITWESREARGGPRAVVGG